MRITYKFVRVFFKVILILIFFSGLIPGLNCLRDRDKLAVGQVRTFYPKKGPHSLKKSKIKPQTILTLKGEDRILAADS